MVYMRLLLVEDEAKLGEYLRKGLAEEGYTVDVAVNGIDGLHLAMEMDYDLIVLDGMLPGIDGFAVLAALRQSKSTPVLMLTARSAVEDRVRGLQSGADDYMIKPLRRSELTLRTQALLRVAYPSQNGAEQLQFGHYTFETRPGRLLKDGEVLDVTHKEFALALLFFRNMGRPLSRAYIHEAVWQRDTALPSRTMDTHVSRVRNKLQLKPEHGYRLVPVYSYGYRLEKLGG